MNSSTRRNQLVSTRIAEWASGKSANLGTTIPAKRKSDALDDSTVWKLRLCYGVDSWIIELPPDSSLSFLTELAFQTRVSGKTFTEAELVKYASEVAEKHDFKIAPAPASSC